MNAKENTSSKTENLAPQTYQQYAPNPKLLGQYVLDQLPPLKEGEVKTVLEIACGNGEFAVELRKRGYNVIATDISQQMIDSTRKAFKDAGFKEDATLMAVTLAGQDIAKIFKPNSFDYVMSNGSLHWLKEPELKECLAGVSTLLKAEGKFIDANASADHPKNPSLYQSLMQAMRECGLPVDGKWHHISSEKLKQHMAEAGLDVTKGAGTKYSNVPFNEDPKLNLRGPENWMRPFANTHLDREKHPNDLTSEELDRVTSRGGEIYREACKAVGKDTTRAQYERHEVCVELSLAKKQEKSQETQKDAPKSALDPSNFSKKSSSQVNFVQIKF